METDENAPPFNKEKPTQQAGLLSPFGFLAGVRAMLSPSVKESAEASDSTVQTSARPVLRDMNMFGSSKAKTLTSAVQAPLPGVSESVDAAQPTEDGVHLLSPGNWSEKGERTSVASEVSFVSASSTDINTSFPDIIQPSSPCKPNRIESDTDTSTAYESAGETEWNISSLDDPFSVSDRGVVPIAVSSPFEGDFTEPDSAKLKKHADTSCDACNDLNKTVQLQDSCESNAEICSISFLTDHLGSLSLHTPLKQKSANSPEKTHITLDSDVSADISSLPDPDNSVLSCDTEINTTIVVADESDERSHDSSEAEQISEELREEVHVLSDSFEDPHKATIPQGSQITEEKLEPLIEEIRTSLSDSAAIQDPVKESIQQGSQISLEKPEKLNEEEQILSNLVTSEGSLKKTLPQEFQSPQTSITQDGSNHDSEGQGIGGNSGSLVTTEPKFLDATYDTTSNSLYLDQSDLSLTEANLLEGFEKSFHLSCTDFQNTSDADLSDERKVLLETIVEVKKETEVTDKRVSSTGDLIAECLAEQPLQKTDEKSDNSTGDLIAESLAEQPLQKTDEKNDNSTGDLVAESLAEQPQQKTDEKSDNSTGDFIVEGPAEQSQQETLEDRQSEESTNAVAPEEIPILPKATRTFEEILEAQLAAQGDPENAVPFFTPGEIPIPVKAPRTFEEILAAELEAQGDPESAVPSFTSDGARSASKEQHNLEETSTADASFAKIITSKTSALDAECEPEFISDPVHNELEPVVHKQLDTLFEKCKQQELDLELAGPNTSSASKETRNYINCLSETQSSNSSTEELTPSDVSNQTVFMVDRNSLSPVSKENFSPEAGQVQVVEEHPLNKPIESDYFESEEFKSADAFKDPSAFDFLLLHGCTRSARDLRKESLYVKFDPLVGSLVSDTRCDTSIIMHPENSSENQNGAAAGTTDGFQSKENTLHASETLVSLSPSAASKQIPNSQTLDSQPSQSSVTATPVKRNLVMSTPVKTPAHIMLNETLESIGSRGTLFKQEDLIKKLTEHQSILEAQDKAYQERISDLECRLQEMEIEKAEQLKEKEKQLEEKVQSISELRVVMKEYEQTISRIVGEKSQQKAAFEEKQAELIRDRDEAQQHLNNMEMAFADIHKKYERLKTVVDAFKKNEESLNAALSEKNADIDKIQSMYDMLKSHAVQKLEKANQDLEAMKQKHQQENAKLKAMIKKLEIKAKSVEDALDQKVKENQALTAICDELINKVGD